MSASAARRARRRWGAVIRAVELFCGAGGATEGLRRAGVRVVAAVDRWMAACRAHRRWHPDVPTICADVRDATRAIRLPGPVDLLWASPSCKPYSMANRTPKRGTAHPEFYPLAQLVDQAIELGARWLLIENVMGLVWSREGAEELARLRSHVAARGLCLTANQIASNSLGVEQERRRLILIVGPGYCPIPNGTDYVPPARTIDARQAQMFGHGAGGDACAVDASPPGRHANWTRVAVAPTLGVGELSGKHGGTHDAFGKLRARPAIDTAPVGRAGRTYAEWAARHPEKHAARAQRGVVGNEHGLARSPEALARWRERQATGTMQGKSGDNAHGRRVRTLAECARLQMVPMEILAGFSKHVAHELVGNAVPPPLAEHVVRHLRRADEAIAAQRAASEVA